MSKADELRVMDFLDHILDAIQRINRYTGSIDLDTFLRDEKTQDAVIRNFEIIGEAARNIERHHPNFAAEHAVVPWGITSNVSQILSLTSPGPQSHSSRLFSERP